MLLSDRVAVITGGAKGIGRGIALKFAGEGCSIVIADIAVKEAKDTLNEAMSRGRGGLALQCDVTDSLQVKNVVDRAISQFGKIDILVNNAGGMPSVAPPIENMPDEEWDRVIALNLKSDFLFCKAVVPYMKAKRYGKIINISSSGAISPPRHSIHYNAAKAGVIGFTYDLAGALAYFNINVNAILPGLVRTSFYDPLFGPLSDQQKDTLFEGMSKIVPLQRAGTPDDIAGAALFLASDLGAYVTGTTLLVAGGMPLSPQVPHQ
jgi:NAD(P)-dependent dehydrogenase (short-subunit alcohol dehydrogenase family)